MDKYIFFLALCIPSRLLLAIAARKYMRTRNSAGDIMVMALTITAATWYLMSMGVLRRDVGMEAAGGVVWWQRLRPFHATMYALCVIFYTRPEKRSVAYRFLLADALAGLAFSLHNRLT